MRNTFKVATIGGVEIFIHWSWLIIVGVITLSLGDYYYHHFSSWSTTTAYIVSAISAILLFATVLLHELAHALTARSRNLPVNSITLYILGGVANLSQEPADARTELVVAIAGPATSLALSAVCFVLLLLARSTPSEVQAILSYLAVVNLILVIFNLVPGFPLDGGRVLRSIIWMTTRNRRRATQIASYVGQAFGYLFVLVGLWEAFFLGDVIGGIYLAFIGWFLQNAAGAVNQQDALEQMLRGVDVVDVMDPAPPGVPPSLSVGTLIERHMLDQNQRAVPIVDRDGTLLGLVTVADVRHVPREEWMTTSISRIMQPREKLSTVAETDHLANALQVLAVNRYHQLPVMQDGRMTGMLNRAHVLEYLHLRRRLDSLSGADRGRPPS